MKIKTERVIIVTFLIVMLIIPAFCTADAPLPIRLLTGEAPESMRIVLSAPEVRKMSQFDDARTAQLNRLIRHLALDVTLGRDVSRTGILIDQQEILSWIQKESGNGNLKIYSFDPSSVYTEKQNPAEETGSDSLVDFLERDLIQSGQHIDAFYSLFEQAPQAFAERVRNEKTELRFSGFGKAIRRITIPFPANYVQESFPKALADAAESETLKKTISGLSFSGSQKIGLLYDENGKIVRITFDGTVGKTPETLRKVSLIWKCLREEGHVKDSITLKTPAIKGADKDNVVLERDLLEPAGEEAGNYSWDIQIDHRAGKEDRKQTHFSAGLSETDAAFSGKIEYSVKRDGENPRIQIIPEIRKESNGEYKGTLEIADYSGKIEKDDVLIHIQLQTGESPSWPAAEPDPENGNREQETPEDTIAGIIIRKLFELPEEDIEYFSHEIPTDLWLELIQ